MVPLSCRGCASQLSGFCGGIGVVAAQLTTIASRDSWANSDLELIELLFDLVKGVVAHFAARAHRERCLPGSRHCPAIDAGNRRSRSAVGICRRLIFAHTRGERVTNYLSRRRTIISKARQSCAIRPLTHGR